MPRKREKFAASFLLIINTKIKIHIWMWCHTGSVGSLAFHSEVDPKCWLHKETGLVGVELGPLLLVMSSYSPGQCLNICARGCPTLGCLTLTPPFHVPCLFPFFLPQKLCTRSHLERVRVQTLTWHGTLGCHFIILNLTDLLGEELLCREAGSTPRHRLSPLLILYSSIISSRLQVYRPPP